MQRRLEMKEEDISNEPGTVTVETTPSDHRTAGFIAGILFGAFLGAGFALLFAPERGEKTRGRLRRRMQSLREDAREGIDRAGSRTREELRRRQHRIRKELERARERAQKAVD
jgi:gas vesicle protein